MLMTIIVLSFVTRHNVIASVYNHLLLILIYIPFGFSK